MTNIKSFSYIIQIALTVTKNGPDAEGVAWLRRELGQWFAHSWIYACVKKAQ